MTYKEYDELLAEFIKPLDVDKGSVVGPDMIFLSSDWVKDFRKEAHEVEMSLGYQAYEEFCEE